MVDTNLGVNGQYPKYKTERQVSNVVGAGVEAVAVCAATKGLLNAMDKGDVLGRPSIYPGSKGEKFSKAVTNFLGKIGDKFAPNGSKFEKYLSNLLDNDAKTGIMKTMRGKAIIPLVAGAGILLLTIVGKRIAKAVKIAKN